MGYCNASPIKVSKKTLSSLFILCYLFVFIYYLLRSSQNETLYKKMYAYDIDHIEIMC